MDAGKHLDAGEDADLACQRDLKDQFDSLLKIGVDRGWSRDEVANAVLSLAQEHVQDSRDHFGRPDLMLQ